MPAANRMKDIHIQGGGAHSEQGTKRISKAKEWTNVEDEVVGLALKPKDTLRKNSILG